MVGLLFWGCAPPEDASDASGESETAQSGEEAASAEEDAAALPDGDDVMVERVVDGDTLVVTGDERVRLIGIDTPESVHPSKPVECFGPEAAGHLTELVPAGTTVRLVHDVERHDRYERTLAYVWRADGLDVNRAMVEDGYAMAYTVPPNVDRQQDLLDAQRKAREDERGLWGGCAGELDLPPPAPPAPPGSGEPPGDTDPSTTGSCHESYPGVCIPPPPPDLDCGDLPHRHVRVLPPDPHNLDGDGDGTGCQS